MELIIVWLVVLAGAFFFLIVLPQRRRVAAHQQLMASLEVGDQVVAVHGQSDQLRLLRPGEQRAALDRFAGAEHEKLFAAYRETYAQWRRIEDDLADRRRHARERSQEADLLVKQTRLGTPMDEALKQWSERCRSRNVDAIVTALTVGRQTGGDLPKVLETTGQERLIAPDEVAKMVLDLCRDDAAGINGETLVLSGKGAVR